MKRLFSIVAILCAAAMILGLTGCGESKKPETTTAAAETTVEETTEAAAETTTEAAAEETTEAAASDALTPSIVIEYGDFDGIVALAKDAQNMKIAEGTVARISGTILTDTMDPGVMESDGNGLKKGITMHINGEWEKPKNGSDIEVIGTFTKGQFVMEFHVLPENIIVKE